VTGELFIHSVAVERVIEFREFREETKLSHIIHMNITMAKNEIRDPKDETMFQVVNASG